MKKLNKIHGATIILSSLDSVKLTLQPGNILNLLVPKISACLRWNNFEMVAGELCTLVTSLLVYLKSIKKMVSASKHQSKFTYCLRGC